MTSKEIDNLAQRIGDYFHHFKDYTMFEYDNTAEDVARRVEQLKRSFNDVDAIDEVIFEINDCNRNLDDSHSLEAYDLITLLKEQRSFLEGNKGKVMVADTNYEVKHAIHVGDREIIFAEDMNAENGMNWFVADYTHNAIIGEYSGQISDDYIESMQEFTKCVNQQLEAMKSEIAQSKPDTPVFTAEHCHPNDYGQSIDGKIVAIKAAILRPEYRRGDVQLVLVNGGNGSRANPNGRAVYCYHLNDGTHTRFERHDVQGEVKAEFLPKWAKDKATEIQAEKANPAQKKPKDREER